MQRIGHVDALPPGCIDRKVDDVTRLRHDAGGVQDVEQRRPDPLRDVRPAFFARDFGDLPADWKPLEVVQRERRRLRDEAFDGEPPVLEAACLKALEVIAWRRDLVGERRIRDLAAAEFARQRMSREEPLRGIGQRLARSVDAAADPAGPARTDRRRARRRRGPTAPRRPQARV